MYFELAKLTTEVDEHLFGDVLTASAEMMNLFGEPIALNRSAMRITVLGSDRAVDILGCPGG